MRYTRHIKARTTSLGYIETGVCEEGSVITDAVQAILKQDGEEVRLVTVDEDTQLFALEVIRGERYALHVARTAREIDSLLEKYGVPKERAPLPDAALKPSQGFAAEVIWAIHYQGTASFAAKLHFKPEEASA